MAGVCIEGPSRVRSQFANSTLEDWAPLDSISQI